MWMMANPINRWITARILSYLEQPTGRYAPFFAVDPDAFANSLRPGDVVLIEGNTRLSAIIKHLTQSTWSHAALFVGEAAPTPKTAEPAVLVEAEVESGVLLSPLSKYAGFNTRICRPVGLSADDANKVIDYALERIGMQYDSKQILDLARYLYPYPPVPVALRRRLLAIGAGDPTRAICSTLIGNAFRSIRYPILPDDEVIEGQSISVHPYVQSENNHIRRHGLFTPRDFDISPYFKVIKPGIEGDFDYRSVSWISKRSAEQ
jgi:permuted papain-like amidase YaeF/Yiix C92 family enzyme